MKEFSWLAYSPSSDEGFCKVCTLFGDEVKHENNTTIKILFLEALTAKKYSYRYLKDHDASTGLHKKAVPNYTVMMMQTSGKRKMLRKIFKLPHQKNWKLEQL